MRLVTRSWDRDMLEVVKSRGWSEAAGEPAISVVLVLDEEEPRVKGSVLKATGNVFSTAMRARMIWPSLPVTDRTVSVVLNVSGNSLQFQSSGTKNISNWLDWGHAGVSFEDGGSNLDQDEMAEREGFCGGFSFRFVLVPVTCTKVCYNLLMERKMSDKYSIIGNIPVMKE